MSLKIKELFDEKSEIAAWVVMLAAFVLLFTGKLEQWPFIAMVGLALLTLLGTGYYGARFRVGPQGVEVEQ